MYQGFDREDGLWDIEAQLTDVKTYGFEVSNERPFPANEPIHNLKIRVTLDNKMVIQDIATSMDDIPHPECVGAPHGMHKLIGCTMGPGWRKVINQHVGGTEGCTHLREMLFNMATAAYQTLPAGQWQRRELAGQPHPEMTQAPYFLGQCHSWAYDSPTVQRAYPMFFKTKAPQELKPKRETMLSKEQVAILKHCIAGAEEATKINRAVIDKLPQSNLCFVQGYMYAFNCELELKRIITELGRPFAHEHNLKKLVLTLPPEFQKLIRDSISNFDEEIEKNSNYFIENRYLFSKDIGDGISINVFFLFQLREVLKKFQGSLTLASADCDHPLR